MWKTYFRKIVSWESTLDVLKFLLQNNLSEKFFHVATVYKIHLAAPMTIVASAERYFSRLKYYKKWFAACICQEWLVLLSITLIENEPTLSINFDDLINEIAEKQAVKRWFKISCYSVVFIVLHKSMAPNFFCNW